MMKRFISLQHLLIGFAMLCTAGLALAMKPTSILADRYEKLDLDVLIPKQFNDWRMEEMTSHLVNPEEQSALNKIYAQTLSRSYVNTKGEHVMLSIAYGKNQNDGLGAHLPEGCYGGQGFSIQDSQRVMLITSFGNIPAIRLIASKDERIEPITYWLTTGEKVAYPGWETKKLKLYYALKGVVPDGLLMRISSITSDSRLGYALQARFADDLLASVLPSQRFRLTGIDGQNQSI